MAREALPPFVLVAGAWLGGWAWRDVARELRAAGHEVHPATLTGLGDRAHLARPEVDLDTHVSDVLGVLDAEDLGDAVLVGHSYAGTVVAGVADRRPERLGAVVWLDTAPLPDGVAITDALSPEQRAKQEESLEDGWRLPVADPETLASGLFGSTAGLDDAQLRMIAARGTPQPYATFTSPLRVTGGKPPGHRHVMVICTEGGLSADLVRDLIASGDPRAAAMTGSSWEFHELPTGHWPMFSMPAEVAALLHRIAAA